MKSLFSTPVLIAKLAQRLRTLAIEEAPVGRNSERHRHTQLRDSIKEHILSNTEAVVGPNVPYARAVHDGRPPMVIKPARKKALYWKGAAHPVKAVRHPGIRPNPYLARAAQRFTTEPLPPDIRAYVGESMARQLEAHFKSLGLEVKRG